MALRLITSGPASTGTSGDADANLGNSLLRHWRVVRRFARGVVHVHDRLSPLSFLALGAARRAGSPTVFTIHGVPNNLLLRRPGVDVFHRAACRLADHVIPVNRHVRDAVARHVDSARCTVIPAFIPPSRAEIESIDPEIAGWLEATQGPLVTLAVYRVLSPHLGMADLYGLSTVTDVAETLAGRPGGLRLAVLLAQSPQTDDERAYLQAHRQRLEAALGARARVFIGKYAPPVVARSQVFLRPTRTDGDAVSVREALGLGIPVLASDAAPRPAGTVLHRAGDGRQLAEQIEGVLADRLPPPAPGRDDSTVEEIAAIYAALRAGRTRSSSA